MEQIEIFNKGKRPFIVNDLITKNKKQTQEKKTLNPNRMVTLEKSVAEKLLKGYPRELIRSSERKEDNSTAKKFDADKKKFEEDKKKFEEDKKNSPEKGD